MVEQLTRSYIILARVQAITCGLIAAVIFALYGLRPSLLTDTGVSLMTAVLSVAAVVYFLTLHQIIGRTKLALSTLILTIITAINFVLIIAATGGLDSPYYSLWLLAIVVAGIFGTRETIAVLGMTLAYYLFAIVSEGLHTAYLRDHLIQLIITFVAAGLAEWVHSRSRRAMAQTNKLANLSGQLSEEQLKAQVLMKSMGEGVMVINAERQIQLFNPAAQALTGWDEASAQSIDYNLVLQLATADEKPITLENDPFAEAWQKRTSVVRDNLMMTTRAGRKITLNLSVSPITDNAGVVTGAIALFRDISREKAVERQKDEFVSTASHEMRTPVAAIEGYISLAMNANVATIDDRARGYLTKAHETIQHLGELFRDLLSVTKAEEGNLNLRIEAVNLNELLTSVVDDMQFSVQKKNLTLVFQAATGGGKGLAPIYYVAANPERLREVVMNLIDNGIKFTSEGGLKVTMEGNTKSVQVNISDTGLGIAAEDMPHLFQKFYRIDSSATRTIGGTGLGLYLCRTVIELFNGRIWVDSTIGKGSTFHFTLPRLAEEEIKRYQVAAPAPAPTSVAAATTASTTSPAAPTQAPAPVMVIPTSPPSAGAAPAPLPAPVSMPIPGSGP